MKDSCNLSNSCSIIHLNAIMSLTLSITHDRLPKETVSRKMNENNPQNFIKGISEDSPSFEGTSTNVTRLGAEDLQTPPKDSR